MPTLTVNQILEAFFCRSSTGKHATTIARYERVENQLRRYLEAEGPETLCIESQVMLAAEMDFEPRGAYGRVMQAEDLLYALPGFLAPAWLLHGIQDQRTQVSLTSRLTQWLCSKQLVDERWHSCAILETRRALDLARNNTRAPRPRGPMQSPQTPLEGSQ